MSSLFPSIIADIALVLVSMVCGWFWFRSMKLERDLVSSEDALRKLYEATKADVFVMERAAEKMQEIEREKAKLVEVADHRLAAIEDVIKERNYAWEMYRRASIGASNAQDMLLREVGRVHALYAGICKETGKTPEPIASHLTPIVSEFKSEMMTAPPWSGKPAPSPNPVAE